MTKTSWQAVSSWYNRLVGDEGSYYHQNVIFPYLRAIFPEPLSLVDFGCGQGAILSILPQNTRYLGLDMAQNFVSTAKAKYQATFLQANVCKPLPIKKEKFDYALFCLSLQNMQDPTTALKNAYNHLSDSGELILILNHPCFRIPQHSDWGFDETQNSQYRKMYRYLSSLDIRIKQAPSKKNSPITWSFHYSLTTIMQFLKEASFCITDMQELISNKTSTGSKKQAENRARKEFPLFLVIRAKKFS